MSIALILAGLVCLVIGGELLVRGAIAAARVMGLSPLVIGLTLVGFGTSTPELVTSLQAALSGSPGIALGNVIGSNTGNILLILGLTALLGSMSVDPAAFRRDGTVMLAAALALVGIVLFGQVGRLSGFFLVAALIVYLALTLWFESRKPSPAAPVYEAEAALVADRGRPIWISIGTAIAGLVVTILGARLLVTGAVDLALAAGLSETLVGLTIVAVGTSLPELVTSVMAILRKQGDVALGNIIGSNIFNVLGILGVTAWVQPLTVPPEIIRMDIWVMLGATVILLIFARTGWRLARREGGVLLALYAAYLGVLISAV